MWAYIYFRKIYARFWKCRLYIMLVDNDVCCVCTVQSQLQMKYSLRYSLIYTCIDSFSLLKASPIVCPFCHFVLWLILPPWPQVTQSSPIAAHSNESLATVAGNFLEQECVNLINTSCSQEAHYQIIESIWSNVEFGTQHMVFLSDL